MREEIANLVYPVLEHGLKLRERLTNNERPQARSEQQVLIGLLNHAGKVQPWAGEGDPTKSLDSGRFLGIRYFLACWLDEIFIDPSPFGQAWDNNKLELQLFRTQLRYKKFWDQVDQTEGVAHGTEALEAALLCVYFGFRGERGEDPERLRDWVSRARKRAGSAAQEQTYPEKPFPTYVPELTSADRYRKMARTFGWGVLAMAPVAAFFIVRLFQTGSVR
jgi:type VI secretion system protein ImpK